MINTSDGLITALISIAISFLLSRKTAEIRQFVIKYIKLPDYDALIYENKSNVNKTITVRNDSEMATIVIRYGDASNYTYSNINPGKYLHIELKPGQVVSGMTYIGTADISLLTYD